MDVFDTIFHTIKEQDIPVVSLGEFAEWWKKRTDFSWNPEIFQGKLHLHPSGSDNSLWVKISLPSGKEILNPVSKQSQLLSGKPVLRKKQHISHIDFKQLRQFNWRMLIHDLDHYWGKLRK